MPWRCCPVLPAFGGAPVGAGGHGHGEQAGPAGCRARRSSLVFPARSGCRSPSPGGSAGRAAWRRWGWAPRRCWHRPWGGRSFASSMAAIRSGMAHMPLPICALPRRPQLRPTSTLFARGLIQALVFMSPLRIMGPRAWRCAFRRRCGLSEAGVDERHTARSGGDSRLSG